MTHPVIRFSTVADAPALAAFARRTFLETFLAPNDPADVHAYIDRAYAESQVAAELADPGLRCFIADADGTIAGFALVRLDAPSKVVEQPASELMRLYVDAPWQGRGLAAQLITSAEELARTHGARALWLGVWEHNPRAIRFYAKYGYTDVGSHPFLLGKDWQTDRIMAKRVGSGE